jgi:hypothetical protein
VAVTLAAQAADIGGAAAGRGRRFGDTGGPRLDGVLPDQAGVDVVRWQPGEVLDRQDGLAGGHLLGVTGLQLEADAGAGIVTERVEHRGRQLLLVLVCEMKTGPKAAGGRQGITQIRWQPQVVLHLVDVDHDRITRVLRGSGAFADGLPEFGDDQRAEQLGVLRPQDSRHSGIVYVVS